MMKELMQRYPQLKTIEEQITKSADMMYDTYKNGGKILICGNGGSCADSDHIVGELMKGFLLQRPLGTEEIKQFEGLCDDPEGFAKNLQRAIPAISLAAHAGVFSAFINDVEPSMVYAQLAYGYATDKDLLIGISTSGNSKNVVNAVIAAKAKGAKTIAMTGEKESKLSNMCDVALQVPETETFKVQELHLPIYHYLCAETEKRAFAE